MKRWFVHLSLSLVIANLGFADESRKLLLPLPHACKVESMAVSPGKLRLATGDEDGIVKIWNWSTRSVEMSLKPRRGDEAKVDWLAWIDDNLLVARSGDNQFRVYDVVAGNEVHRVDGAHRKCQVLLPGQRLAMIGKNAQDDMVELDVIDLKTGLVVNHFPVPEVDARDGFIQSMAGSPDGSRLTVAFDSRSKKDRLIEISSADGHLLRKQELEGYAPEHLYYSPSGQSIAGYGWDLMSWTPSGARSWKPDRSGVSGMTWSSENELLYSIANSGASLYRVNTADGRTSPGKTVEDGGASAPLVMSPDNTPIFSDFHGRLLNADTGADIFKTPPVVPVASIDFHPSGRMLVGVRFGDIQVWDLTSGKLERRITVPYGVKAMATSADGKRLAITNYKNNIVNILDWKTARLLQAIDLGNERWGGYSARFSPNGKLLCTTQHSSNNSDELVLVDIASGEPVSKREKSFRYSFHPTENKWAVVRRDAVAEIDLTTGEETVYKLRWVRDCAYDFKGTLHAVAGVGSESKLVRFYPKATGRLDEVQVIRTFREAEMDQLVYSQRDRSWWLHATSNAIFQVDDSGKERVRLPDRVADPNLSRWRVLPTDLVATIGQDNAVEFWRGGQTNPEGQLISFDGGRDWLVTSGAGFFDGSSEAGRLVEWQVGRDRYRVDQFFKQGYRPGLLREFFRGARFSSQKGPLLAVSKPPQLEILSPAPGSRLEERETDVRVRFVDQGFGWSQPKLYVNGHAVPATNTRASGDNIYVFKARLQPGLNDLRASGFDQSGQVESRGDRMRITCVAEARRKPILHILSVGVNQASGGRPLQFAEKDAQAIAQGLKSGLYSEANIQLLLGKKAGKSQVDAAFRAIEAKAEPQDTVVVFFAGHGVAEDAGYRFLLSGKDSERDSLSSSELAGYLEALPAHRQFVMLDTCHSAAATPDLAARFAISQQQMARGSGTFLLAACRSDQTAAEISSLKHGLLTYSLLSGFSAKGASPNQQGQVTVNSLIQYVSSSFPEISRRHSQSQELYQFSNGSDFPLVQRGGKS